MAAFSGNNRWAVAGQRVLLLFLLLICIISSCTSVTTEDKRTLTAMIDRADDLRKKSDYAGSLSLLDSIETRATAIGFDSAVSAANYVRTLNYYYDSIPSNDNKLTGAFKKHFEIAQRKGYSLLLARGHIFAGQTQSASGGLRNALANYTSAYSLAEGEPAHTDDARQKRDYVLAVASNNQGDILRNMYRYGAGGVSADSVKKVLTTSRRYGSSLKDDRLPFYYFVNLSDLHLARFHRTADLSAPDSSRKYLDSAEYILNKILSAPVGSEQYIEEQKGFLFMAGKLNYALASTDGNSPEKKDSLYSVALAFISQAYALEKTNASLPDYYDYLSRIYNETGAFAKARRFEFMRDSISLELRSKIVPYLSITETETDIKIDSVNEQKNRWIGLFITGTLAGILCVVLVVLLARRGRQKKVVESIAALSENILHYIGKPGLEKLPEGMYQPLGNLFPAMDGFLFGKLNADSEALIIQGFEGGESIQFSPKSIHSEPQIGSVQAFNDGEEKYIADARQDELYRSMEPEKGKYMRSLLFVPVLFRENPGVCRKYGVLSVQSLKPNAFTQDQREVLHRIADMLALVMEYNAQLLLAQTYKKAMDSASCGIVIIDAKTRLIEEYNETFRNWHNTGDVRGKNISGVSAFPEFDQKWQECLETGHTEFECTLGGGRVVTTVFTLARDLNKVVGVDTDRTELVKEMKTNTYLLGVVGHDYRDRLVMVARGLSEAFSEKDERRFNDWIHYLKKFHGFIKSLFSFVKSQDAGTKKPSINLRNAVDDVLSEAAIFKLTGAVQTVNELPAAISVQVNPEVLMSILRNVIFNALDELQEQNGARVNVASEIKTGRLHIYVKDNGNGISDEEKRNALYNTAYVDGNLGINWGSTITGYLVRVAGGNIRAYNTENPKGFCVEIELPYTT